MLLNDHILMSQVTLCKYCLFFQIRPLYSDSMEPKNAQIQVSQNYALGVLKDGLNLSYEDFATRLKVSKPFLQAIMQGTRRANEPLALRVMAQFGMWYECVLNHSVPLLDLYGNLYDSLTLQAYKALLPEELSDAQLEEYLQPFADLFRAAAATGKVRVLSILLQLHLKEVLDIYGLGEGLKQHPSRMAQVTEYTFGQLRADSLTARVLKFEDDPARTDDEIAYRVETVPKKTDAIFPGIYPNLAEISRAYQDAVSKAS